MYGGPPTSWSASFQGPYNKGDSKGKGTGKGKGDAKGNKRIPDAEFQALLKLPGKNSSGKTTCRWWNSSAGCTTAVCGFAHECAECGGAHAWASHHNK